MNNSKFDARLDTVPLEPGVYLMKDKDGTVIYVGKAKKLRNRLHSYFGGEAFPNAKVAAMVSHVADFEYTVVGSESEALLLENNLIKHYMPQYNILLRDDRGYPYICVTMNETFPRVFKAFRPDSKLAKEGALYFGPYMSGDCFNVLKAIDEIFPLKKCRKVLPRDIGKERPCLNYHIGKCLAPCAGGINADKYREMTQEIVMFFRGKYDDLTSKIKERMTEAAEKEDFESAMVYRDRLFALQNVQKSQRVFMNVKRDVDAIGIYSEAGETCVRKLELRDGRIVGSSTYFMSGDSLSVSEIVTGFIMQYYSDAPFIPPVILVSEKDDENTQALEEILTEEAGHKVSLHVPERGEMNDLLKLADSNAREMMVRRILRGGGAGADPNAAVNIIERMMGVPENSIKRIESYDISNLGNDDICSGMVVFRGGKADKSAYRLFKMKEVTEQDDFASMRETLKRRFAHDGSDGFEYPQLILVDGGKGQLSAVASVVNELVPDKHILLAGMFKNDRHRTSGLVFTDGRELHLEGENQTDEQVVLLRFLSAVQNEVHRYAITYQRKLAKKRNLKYKLEEISGIGPSKRKELLAFFGTIKAVSEASEEELSKCHGITTQNAKSIYYHFHGEQE